MLVRGCLVLLLAALGMAISVFVGWQHATFPALTDEWRDLSEDDAHLLWDRHVGLGLEGARVRCQGLHVLPGRQARDAELLRMRGHGGQCRGPGLRVRTQHHHSSHKVVILA